MFGWLLRYLSYLGSVSTQLLAMFSRHIIRSRGSLHFISKHGRLPFYCPWVLNRYPFSWGEAGQNVCVLIVVEFLRRLSFLEPMNDFITRVITLDPSG